MQSVHGTYGFQFVVEYREPPGRHRWLVLQRANHCAAVGRVGLRLARQKGTYLVMDIHDADYILGEGEKTGFLRESLGKERKIGQRQRDNLRKARFMIQAAHRDTLHSDAWKLTCIKDKSLQSWSYFFCKVHQTPHQRGKSIAIAANRV